MFEELRDNQEFRALPAEGRQKYLEDYKQKVILPMMDQRGTSPEKRAKVMQLVDEEYGKVAVRSGWESFRDSAYDLLNAPARMGLDIGQFAKTTSNAVMKGVAEGLDLFTKTPQDMLGTSGFFKQHLLENEEAVARNLQEYTKARQQLTYHGDMARYHDVAVNAVLAGGAIGRMMFKFKTLASPWAQGFLEATAQTTGRAVTSQMFTDTAGALVVEAAMDKVVDPYIEQQTDWSPETKMAATMGAYLALGFGSGFTLEYRLDKLIGNPNFTNVLESAVKKSAGSTNSWLTQPESLLDALTNDPELVKRLGRAIEETGARQEVGLLPEAARAVDAAQNLKLQRLVDGITLEPENIPVNTPVKSQFEQLAEMIQGELAKTAERRKLEAAEPDGATNSLLLQTDEAKEVLEGALVTPKGVDGVVSSVPQGADVTTPAPVSAPALTWRARLNAENKIVMRASAVPNAETIKALKEVGLKWQPNKLFDPRQPEVKGVFYGANTPEAHALVRQLYQNAGQAVSKQTQAQTPQAPAAPVTPPTTTPILTPVKNKIQTQAKKVVSDGTEKSSQVPKAAQTKKTTSAPITTTAPFEIVELPDNKMKLGVFSGHVVNGKNVSTATVGMAGGLGNPFKTVANGGTYTPEEAVEKFNELFLRRVDQDENYANWVMSLEGKKVGYHNLEQNGNHLKVVQEWIADAPKREAAALAAERAARPKAWKKPKNKLQQKAQPQNGWQPVSAATPLAGKKVRAEHTWMAEGSIADKYPNAHKALQNSGMRSVVEGWTWDEVVRTMVGEYNKFKPGQVESLAPHEWDAHLKVLSELEELRRSGRKTLFTQNPKAMIVWAERWINNGLDELASRGLVNDQQRKVITETVKRMRFTPDFLVTLAENRRSFYEHLTNIMYLRRPADFFHETGHWAWLNVLSKQERLDFYKTAMIKHGSTEEWDKLWPLRKAFGEAVDRGEKDFPMKTYQGHFQNVTELYADLFRRYVHNYHMSEQSNKHLLGKMLTVYKQVYGALVGEPHAIPKSMRRFVEHLMQTPTPRGGKMRLNEVEDLVQRTALYVDEDTFRQTLSHALDGADRPMQDEFLLGLMTRGESAFDAWKRSGADLEGLLNRVYMDVLAHHHLDVGDSKQIELVLERFREVFEPSNQREVVQQLLAMGSRVSKSKYGEITDPSQTTAATVRTESEARKIYAQLSAESEEFYKEGAELQYRAMRNFYNHLGELYQASKFHKVYYGKHPKRAKSRAEVVRVSQDEWATLQARLMDDALLRRQESVSLDNQGFVDEFSMRPKVGDDEFDESSFLGDGPEEPFENVFHKFDDDELRWMQLQTWPQIISAGTGLHMDDENGVPIPGSSVRLSWSPEVWMSRGWGPALSAYSLFNRGIRGKAKAAFYRKFDALSVEDQDVLRRKWTGVVKNDIVRAFRRNEGLSEELVKIQQGKQLETNRIHRKFFDLAEDLNKRLTLDEQRLVAQVLTNEGGLEFSKQSLKVQAATRLVENLFEGVKANLITAGIPEALVKNLGEDFLPQVFNAHTKNWWMQGGGGRRMRNLYETINAKFLAPKGVTQTVRATDPEMRSIMESVRGKQLKLEQGVLLDEFQGAFGEKRFVVRKADVARDASLGEPLNTWRVVDYSMAKGRLTMNRKYSGLERSILKEELSIVPRLVELGNQAGKLIAQAKTMQKLNDLGDLVVDPKKLEQHLGAEESERMTAYAQGRGFVEVPNTETIPGVKRYGALAGKLVDPEVMYVLKNVTPGQFAPDHPVLSKLFSQYKAGIGLWKIGKTAFNVTTHGINFIGNSAMCILDGRNPLDVLWRGGKALHEKGSVFTQAIEAGLMDSSVMRSELGLGDFMRQIERLPNAHPTQGFESAVAGWMQGVSTGLKKAAYGPMRVYELGDQIYKLGVFAQELDAGKTGAQAIAAANRLFFDYSNLPTGVKFIRDTGIMPFVSYTYNLIPRLVDFAANNPHRLLGLIGTLELANEMIMTQEWGEDFEDVKNWQQDVMPDWMNRNVYGSKVRGGILRGTKQNKFGHKYSEWLDYSQVIPGGDLLNDGGVLRGIPFGQNPILSIASGLFFNKDPHLGNEIAPFPDAEAPALRARNAQARLKYVLRTVLPNLPVYPGAYSLERLGQALTKSGTIPKDVADYMGWTGMDYYGTPEDVTSELFGLVTGIRPRRLYAESETVRSIEKHKFGIKKEQNELKRRVQDRRISGTELAAQQQQMQTVTRHNLDQIQRLGEVYRKAQKVLAQQATGR